MGVLLLLGLIGGVAYYKMNSEGALSGVDDKKYQALFLTNGQVYFGKLSQTNSKTVSLKDVYYLQFQEPLQPKADTKPADVAKQTNQTPTLAKLGNSELHAPEDAMYIDRSQVLFWENLKDNGKVVKAIKEYKKKQ